MTNHSLQNMIHLQKRQKGLITLLEDIIITSAIPLLLTLHKKEDINKEINNYFCLGVEQHEISDMKPCLNHEIIAIPFLSAVT